MLIRMIRKPLSAETINEIIENNIENEKILKIILNKYDLISEENKDKILISAIENNYIEIVKIFINKGIDVNKNLGSHKYDSYGFLIAIASQYGHIEIVKLLINAGANILKYGNCGDNLPLLAAVGYGQIELVKFLIKIYNTGTIAALKLAASNGQLEIVKLLIKADDNSYNIALYNAIRENEIEIVDYIIKKGVDVNEIGYINKKDEIYEYYDLIEIAIDRDRLEISKLLINAGLDLNRDYKPPLINAVVQDRINLVKLFIEKGANVHIKDDEGNSIISILTKSKHVDRNHIAEILEILIKEGVNVNEKNKEGKTALMLLNRNIFIKASKGNMYKKMKEILEKAGAK